MYIALFCMIAGIVAGRVSRRFLRGSGPGRVVFISILLLLFLLGIQIGQNEHLFRNLPVFGWKALAITLAAMTGSIICARFLERWLRKKGLLKDLPHA